MEKVKKALEDALDIFLYLHEGVDYYGNRQNYSDEIVTTRLALAELEQIQQEPAQAVPVAVVVTEPDYWSSGHFYKGSRPYIKNSDIAKLPIGTKLYTAPPAIDDETRKMVLELCNTIINGSIYWTITLAKQIREKLETKNAPSEP